MTTTKSITRAPVRFAQARDAAQRRSNFLFGRELARLVFEHHRNIVLDRICEPARAADQLFFGFLVDQWTLAQRAHEDIKQLGVHGAISVWRGAFGQAPDRPRPRPEGTTNL